jgi:AraC-like DNA-binding protein
MACVSLSINARPDQRGTPPVFDVNVTAVESVLHRSTLFALGEYRCPVNHPQFSGGGPQLCPFIVFPRCSVRITRLGGKPLLHTPNSISLYDVGDIYCRDMVSREGDRSDWIAVAPSLLREIGVRQGLSPSAGERIFDRPIAQSTPMIYSAQRALFTALRTNQCSSVLEVEERVIALVEWVCGEIARGNGIAQAAQIEADQCFWGRSEKIVEATLKVLATEFCSALGIADVSARVHCSPGYLSRLFRRSTGFTLHEYQQQLRLRASLELLLDSRDGLSEVALRLGFSNHSHFTSAFRRQFGMTPREFRGKASRRSD